MKHTLTAILLAMSLCASGMAQTTSKPTLPQTSGSTGTNMTLQRVTTGDNLLSKPGAGTLVITEWATPITIDGETTDCTQPHLIKALKIAAGMIADPNQQPCTECVTAIYLNSPSYTTYPYSQKPVDEKRAQAERLKAEADRLEAESKRVQWVRAVMAVCEK